MRVEKEQPKITCIPRTYNPYSLSRNAFTTLSVIPVIVLTYIQLCFNVSVAMFLFYGLYRTYAVLHSDLQRHLNRRSQIVLSEIVQCSREYVVNECSTPLPAMTQVCETWRMCMNQDVQDILQSKEGAAILAEIMNHFFSNINDRTIWCCGGLFVIAIVLTNTVLSINQRSYSRRL